MSFSASRTKTLRRAPLGAAFAGIAAATAIALPEFFAVPAFAAPSKPAPKAAAKAAPAPAAAPKAAPAPAANPKAAAANPKEEKDPKVKLITDAERFFSQGNFPMAGKNYQELLTEYKDDLYEDAKGLCRIRLASCYLGLAAKVQLGVGDDAAQEKARALKDGFLQKAETELREFLKNPSGTGKFFSETNNYLVVGKITLGELLGKLKKFEEARKTLDEVRRSSSATKDEQRQAVIKLTVVLEDEVANGDEAKKKQIYEYNIGLLKPIVAQRNFFEPVVKDAGSRLVEIYTKLGDVKQARALNDDINAGATGNPLDTVMANFRRFEIGDTLFQQAENESDPAAKMRIYQQTLITYQETLRMKALSLYFDDAVKVHDNRINAARKAVDAAPADDEAKNELAKAEAEKNAFVETLEKFKSSKDYDAFISYRIALCLTELKRPWEAYIAFRDIFDNAPNFAKKDIAHFCYIENLRAMKRNKEALAACEEYLKLYPNTPEAADVAVKSGEILYNEGEFDAAIKQFRKIRNESKIPLSIEYKEWIDWYICSALFQSVEWVAAEEAIRKFLGTPEYAKSTNMELMVYQRALCFFYLGDYPRTREALGGAEGYITRYPRGQFMPDARYRLALVKFGLANPDNDGVLADCHAWLKLYEKPGPEMSKDMADAIERQRPEIYTLIGDVHFRKFDNKDKKLDEDGVQKELKLAIEAYILAAKGAQGNAQTLQFVTSELNRRLPSLNEWAKMLDIYTTFYEWDKDSPEALGYLYWVLRSVEKLGKTVDERRAAITKANLDPKKYEAYFTRDAVAVLADDIIRNINNGKKENVEQLIAELIRRVVEGNRRAASAETARLRAIEEAKVKPGNDAMMARYNEAVEAEKAAAEKDHRVPVIPKKPELVQPKPVAPVAPADATDYVLKLLKLDGKSNEQGEAKPEEAVAADPAKKDDAAAAPTTVTLVAQARGFYTRAEIAQAQARAWRRPELMEGYNKNLQSIIRIFKPEEVSASILSTVIDYLIVQKDYKNAEIFAQHMLDFMRDSSNLDYAYAAKIEILLDRVAKAAKKDDTVTRAIAADALTLINEANELDIVYNKEREMRLLQVRALLANLPGPRWTIIVDKDGKEVNTKSKTGEKLAPPAGSREEKVDKYIYDARKILLGIAANKTWRGETTAWALYYLGQLEETNRRSNEAINYYTRCFLSWKKFGNVTAKAYLRAVELYIEKIKLGETGPGGRGYRENVGNLIHEWLQPDNPASKAPEAEQARLLQPQYPYTPPPPKGTTPTAAPAAPAAAQ